MKTARTGSKSPPVETTGQAAATTPPCAPDAVDAANHQSGESRRSLVWMAIKTDGLAYDDRLRKEVRALAAAGRVAVCSIETHPAAPAETGLEGLAVLRRHRTLSARLFPVGRGVLAKGMETTLRMLADAVTRRPDTAWIHNPDLLGVVLPLLWMRRLGLVGRVVWDLHELPDAYLPSRVGRRLFAWIARQCDAVITTNEFRRQYLAETGGIPKPLLHVVENYAADEVRSRSQTPVPAELASWLGGRGYLLAQGGGRRDRFHHSLVEACARLGIPLVIVGRAADPLNDPFVWYTGQVPQDDVYAYIDGCMATVVLYERSDLNRWFCSPNRLFQALSRGKPALVGSNPPMKAVIEHTGAGVVLPDDGTDIDELLTGIRTLVHRIGHFQQQAAHAAALFTWSEQEPILRAVAFGGRNTAN
jgi:glycosyltransferase involved in cell wall biosynthesis